jgi:hypothetical protein
VDGGDSGLTGLEEWLGYQENNMKNEQGYTLDEVLFVLWVLVVFAASGTVSYIATHFIRKFW